MTPIFSTPNAAFEQTVRDGFRRQGLMTLYGARLAEVGPGRVVIEMDVRPEFTQQAGLVHGGVIGAIGDSAGGFAALTLFPTGADVVTIEYKINYMRAATGTLLRATGEVVRAGKTITVGRIVCDCGTPGDLQACAVLQATFMRIERT
jgi:uncharacterized protein (TIGR00369 family)